MNRKRYLILFPVAIYLCFLAGHGLHAAVTAGGGKIPSDRSTLNHLAGSVEIPFAQNNGQMDDSVAFYARTFTGAVYVKTDGQIAYTLTSATSGKSSGRPSFSNVILKERPLGVKAVDVTGVDQAATRVNYFRGNDDSKWAHHIPTFRSVGLGEVYPGIHLELKARGRTVEKFFYIRPGAKPEQIRMQMIGAQLQVNEQGELVAAISAGRVAFSAPIAYQRIKNVRRPVDVSYVVRENNYGFRLGPYDTRHELVIDPFLKTSFVGGSDEDTGFALTIDSTGNAYVVGLAQSLDFPGVAPGASADDTFQGLAEAFVAKLSPDLSTLLAVTYLGGSGPFTTEFAQAVAVDSADNVYVAGRTNSSDFPGVNPGSADDTFAGSEEAFIVKLDPSLATILAATYYGGSSNENALAITVDALDNVIVGGGTNASPDLPGVGLGSADPTIGLDEGFVVKLDTHLTTILNATYLGGSGSNERVHALATDPVGNIYAAGVTGSDGFPGVGGGSADSTFGGDFDLEAFVVKLNPNLSTILAASFAGGSNQDSGAAIALDGDGNVFVAGRTSSADFPAVGGASADSTLVGSEDAFVAKLNSNLSVLSAATFLGGSGNGDVVLAMAVDPSGHIFVTGETTSTDFPGVGPGSIDNTAASAEVFITELSSDLGDILNSTYLGGSATEFGFGIALDGAGNIYVGGFTRSSDFPGIGPDSADDTFSVEEAFVSKLTFDPVNQPPECDDAKPSKKKLWPPFHQFVPVNILNVTDIDEDPISITVEYIYQDEPVKGKGTGHFAPDGKGVGTDRAKMRAERSPFGDGRVYHIGFMADDGAGGQCYGDVTVCVPRIKWHKGWFKFVCQDGGPVYDATARH